jgi:repressor LexA
MDAIRELIDKNDYSPSVRQIGERLGLAPATVQQHLDALERKGAIARTGSAFGIEVIDPDPFDDSLTPASNLGPHIFRAPLIGTIAAGEPILAFEDHQETIPLHESMIGVGEHFVLRVQGNSMVDDHILDGDLVVILRTQSVNDGETAVALMEDGTATLKRIFREKARIRLQPANSDMSPIVVDSIDIQGTVMGIIRTCR